MFGRQQNQQQNRSAPVVAQVKRFRSQQEALSYIQQMGGRYRRVDEFTGLPLYKTAANLVLRPNGPNVEILSNCVC